MKKYIFAARHDIHIIDLEKTAKLIEEAYTFVVESVKAGKSVLFVGTKKQAQDAIKEEAERCGQYYVNSRWLGGCLTNFKTIRARIDYLEKLEKMEESGEFDLLPKKEVLGLKKEMAKLQENLAASRTCVPFPASCSSSTLITRTSPLPKPASSTSRSSPSPIPTAIRSHRPRHPRQRRCDPRDQAHLVRPSPTPSSRQTRAKRSMQLPPQEEAAPA